MYFTINLFVIRESINCPVNVIYPFLLYVQIVHRTTAWSLLRGRERGKMVENKKPRGRIKGNEN
jgi:hypothetical protein